MIKPSADMFDNGIITVNFQTKFHIDRKDRDCVTHCTFCPPMVKSKKKTSLNFIQGFCLVKTMVDLSLPVRISFLGYDVYHCTGEPTVPRKVPQFLLNPNSCLLDFSHDDNKDKYHKEYMGFAHKSVLAWGR